jgi:polyferredoxin
MGIDIRDGQQLECITCALCIDACDSVMDKLGKERGLISYATLSDYNDNMALATGGGAHAIRPVLVRNERRRLSDKVAHFHIRKVFRLRTFVYMGIWAAMGIALLVALLNRDRLEVNVLHDRNPQFVTLSDGSIRNGYTVKLLNMIPEPRTVIVTMQGLRGANMSIEGIDQPEDRAFAVQVEPDRLKTLRIFVRQPPEFVQPGYGTFKFIVEDRASYETDEYEANFYAPEK